MRCEGINYKRVDCDRHVDKKQKYCNTHKYFKNFTQTEIDGIREANNNFKVCGRCKRWHNYEFARCEKCTNKSRADKLKTKTEHDKNKCIGPCRGNKKCGHFKINDTNFCERHMYMNEYSKTQFKAMIECSGCHLYKYWDEIDRIKTCVECRNRSTGVRLTNNAKIIDDIDLANDKQKKNKLIDDLINEADELDEIKIKVIDDTKTKTKPKEYHRCCVCKEKDPEKITKAKTNVGNKWFCGKHQAHHFKAEVELAGKKVCADFVRRCRSELDMDYKFAKCFLCLEKDRVADKKLRDGKRKIANEVKFNNIDMIACISCPLDNMIHARDNFIGIDGRLLERCKKCRQNDHKADEKRKCRSRNWKEELDKNPARKLKRRTWYENNYDKILGYCKNYRIRTREKMGDKKFKKMVADASKLYRHNNPEKIKIIVERSRNNIKNVYKMYVRSAKDRNINWELSRDKCYELFTNICYYCGEKYIQNQRPLGIDRIDNSKGYISDNCVTCCTVCNMIKCDINEQYYKSKIKHILSNMFIIPELYINNDIFNNYNSSTLFKDHVRTSKNRKIETILSKAEFDIIKQLPCYMCGKENTNCHTNGIDRINNNDGYNVNNCLSCCGDCNYMKRNYKFDEFIVKLYDIYCNEHETIIKLPKNTLKYIVNFIVKIKILEVKMLL